MSSFQFASGVSAHIFVSWLHPFKEQKLVVVGERQMAVFDDMASSNKLMLYPHRIQWVNRMPIPEKAEGIPVEFEKSEPLEQECRHFMECIETRQAPRTDGEEGLQVLRLLNACQESLEQQGRQIDPAALAPTARSSYSVHPTSCVDEPCEIGTERNLALLPHHEGLQDWSELQHRTECGDLARLRARGKRQSPEQCFDLYRGRFEDDVFLGPSMVFTNVINPRSHIVRRNEYRQTVVKKGASIGANATIVCGHTIGRYAFVGAGAVVTKDVPDYALVVGNQRAALAGCANAATACYLRRARRRQPAAPATAAIRTWTGNSGPWNQAR